MKKLPIVFRQIILLILIAGVASCAGKDKQEKTPELVTGQLQQEILKTVTDPERASQAADLADSLKQIFAEADKQYKTDFETFESINANFDATDAELQTFFDSSKQVHDRHYKKSAAFSRDPPPYKAVLRKVRLFRFQKCADST